MITMLLSSSLFAIDVDKRVLRFEKSKIEKDPRIKLISIQQVLKVNLNKDGWYGYVFNITLKLGEREIKIKDQAFSNGQLISSDLVDIKGLPYKNILYPTLTEKFYDNDYLAAGNKNAKHKLVIFSDPLCPNCTDIMPKLIKDAQTYPNILALYYYPMPLSMHPTADAIVKASALAKEDGIKNVNYKIYTAKFDKHFDPYKEKNNEVALKVVNQTLGTSYTQKDLKNPKLDHYVAKSLNISEEALVQGTPTIFLDGKYDLMRETYKKFIK
jgi:protein-disulfide isomerase